MSRIKSSVKMGQGRRRRACAGALLWPAEVDGTPSAGVRDHRSLARAGAPLWPAEVDGAPAVGVRGPPQPGTRWHPALAGRGPLTHTHTHTQREREEYTVDVDEGVIAVFRNEFMTLHDQK